MWLPEEEKCTISRNVVFDEDKLYKDQGQMEATSSKKKKKLLLALILFKGRLQVIYCVFGTLYVCLTNSFQGFIESF